MENAIFVAPNPQPLPQFSLRRADAMG